MDSLILKINAKTYFFPLPWYDSKKKKRKKKGKCKRSTPKKTNANVWETIQKKMAWKKR